ncbi:PREDICTED: protein trichome birefringence-like 39 [Tarenaya hassleriana]|uniref:protein trichome birefringence-like 39 n=1 Tax=Tarenaya hassleriana TaxID=28532 RepID=UPI00053C3F4F|nr:PREDICTED: protein trichome birefringence-like 39 [Tarenaya hassleriana]
MGFSLHLFLFLLCLSISYPFVSATGQEQSSSYSNSSSDNGVFGARKLAGKCNWFRGRWVYDAKYPLYDPYKCPFIDPQFNCKKYGRPDSLYLKYRWQPFSCSLPRFNGLYFLRKMKGKKIMFVGDSLSSNMWQSLACLIYSWAPNSRFTLLRQKGLSSLTFEDYKVTLLLYRTQFLVDLDSEKVGRVLKLDSIKQGNMWRGMDVLIFDTWHWWTHTERIQPWDYMEDGRRLYKDMDRLVAFYKGLTTWARWINANVDPSKTKVFFNGVSPTHYEGKDWNEPMKSCSSQTQPYFGPKYPAGTPMAWVVVNKVLSRVKKPVYWLDITGLSQLRKDAHPSAYSGNHPGNDCSHWCLPGLPDTWNILFYGALLT